MEPPIIEVKNLSKCYRLGQLGAGSLRDDVERFWNRVRKRNDTVAQTDRKLPENDFWALKDVSFEVQPGEVLGIIGKNGAGKSTLLKILSRITQPTSGEALLRGRVASLLEVGTGFHPELTGRENIFLNGAILGMRKAEVAGKFEKIVEFAEVGPFIDTPVKRYSSGMYVRLAFAVAAHLEPEILIVDEVLAVGDAAFQQKCLGKMRDVSRNEGRTVLFVSHNIQAVRRLCRSCLFLEGGTSSQPMPVDDAIDRYVAKAEKSAHAVSLGEASRLKGHGRQCRLTRLELRGGRSPAYAEACEIDVEFEVFEPMNRLMVGMGFGTPDGGRVMSMDSDAQREAFDLQPGTYCCRFSIDYLPLSPALYVVSVALASGHNYFDFIDSAAVWEVTTGRQDRVSDRGFGGCRIKHVTHLNQIGGPSQWEANVKKQGDVIRIR